jgi:hypothetical protein
VLHLGGLQGVQRLSLDRDHQSQCRVQRAGVALGLRGREQALRAASGSAGQARRLLQECRRRGPAPARLRSASQALELPGDILIGAGRGEGPVPGPTVGIPLRIGDLRQGAVHVVSLLKRRRPVGRRAHQRMPKPHPGAELQQPSLGCRRGSRSPNSQPLGRPPHQQRLADRIGRRQLHQTPRLGPKSIQPPPEALLDPPRQRHRAGQPEPEPARQLRRRQSHWQMRTTPAGPTLNPSPTPLGCQRGRRGSIRPTGGEHDDKRIIAVVGATGRQGGGLVRQSSPTRRVLSPCGP